MKNKCVLILGPESSGSMLIAKILAHALNICEYGEWDGSGWKYGSKNKILHRSIPYGNPPIYPNLDNIIGQESEMYDVYLILCTRDINISKKSKRIRFLKNHIRVSKESDKAKEVISKMLLKYENVMLWSYETFMFLKMDYLQLCYKFLGVASDFIPELKDGNEKWIKRYFSLEIRLKYWFKNLLNNLRVRD